jgi:hypothetical protein
MCTTRKLAVTQTPISLWFDCHRLRDNAALSAQWLSRKYALYFVDGRTPGRVKE